MRRKFSKRHRHRIREILFMLGIAGALATGAFFLWVSTFTLPDLSVFSERKTAQSTKIYDRTGEVLLYDLNRGVKRTVIPDSEISRHIKNATVAIEDSDFYEHRGIKVTAIIRAVLANILGLGYSQGGSTITQQVVKNSLLTAEKKISRKLKEWVLALRLEQVLSKAEILNAYLNDAPYGGVIYGIEEASATYFGRKAADLTIAEAAYLAALPNAPSYYSPYGKNRDRLETRKNLVLAKMLEKHFISKGEYDAASAEKVVWKPQETLGIRAPHFVMWIREYLQETYGEKMLRDGGLKVVTTLDYNLQEKAETLAKKFAPDNKKNFNAENLSLVATDPKTGQVLVMLGSRDYFDKEIDGNFNVALAHRQPGSAFKPIVYAEAFNKGYTPDTSIFDLQTEFETRCKPEGTPIVPDSKEEDLCYMPENFDGKYLGPLTFRSALALSRNIPAIKVFYLAGLKDALRLAKNMGIGSLTDTARYGLTLVLGGGEVSLMDMAGAYGVFAANGARHPPTGILRIEDQAGTVLEAYEPHPVSVLPEQTALMISDILSDDTARALEFGVQGSLYIAGRDVAAKTGTTNDYRDAWILGYAPNLVVGAWAGNNDNSPMEKKIAGFIVAPFWNAFMTEALKSFPPENFNPPAPYDKTTLKPVLAGFWEGGEAYFINKPTGELATVWTPRELIEERVVKNVHSILYWVDKANPLGPPPTTPASDPQFELWEHAVRKWVAEQGIKEETRDIIPQKTDSTHGPDLAPNVSIINPKPSLPYKKEGRVAITIIVSGRFPVSKVDYFLNGAFLGSATEHPWSMSFLPAETENIAEKNDLKAVVYDTVLNRGEAVSSFSITP